MAYTPSAYDALRDQNRIPVAMGQSNADATQTLPFLMDAVTGRLLVSSTGGGSNNFAYNEVVSGSGTSWTLAHTPVTGIALYANGQRLTPGAVNDYTISGTAITTILSWASGSLLADYQY